MLRDLQIVDHLSHILWVILHLDVGEMAHQLGGGKSLPVGHDTPVYPILPLGLLLRPIVS